MQRRTIIASLMAPMAASGAAFAQGQNLGWAPTRPVRIVAGWPAGGSADASLRLIAPHMPSLLGQSVVIENRGGRGGRSGP